MTRSGLTAVFTQYQIFQAIVHIIVIIVSFNIYGQVTSDVVTLRTGALCISPINIGVGLVMQSFWKIR